MWKTEPGSTGRLVQLSLAMFTFYVIFGVATKAFTGPTAVVVPQMSGMSYTVWSTIGGSLMCLSVVFLGGWFRGKSTRHLAIGSLKVPAELAYIIPSGLFTAIIIPTTTLLYILLKSVMVAMVIMRASVILSSRLVDEIQKRQGILKKTVYWEENVAVVFALAAASTQVLLAKSDDFDFLHNKAALMVLGAFVLAYALRIYIMNYYRNTRSPGAEQNNKWYFSIEQISASSALLVATLVLLHSGLHARPVVELKTAVASLDPHWLLATGVGMIYGMVAFFGVFIFMFKGRTATFSGLAYSQTSLAAGTAATLISAFVYHAAFPSSADWASLALIAVAFTFLGLAERKRILELSANPEFGQVVPEALEQAPSLPAAR